MKIIFTALGFMTADAFLVVDGRQLLMGAVVDKLGRGDYEFWPSDYFMEQYVKRDKYVKWKDIPRNEEIIAEYKRQLAEKGITTNTEVVYAG